MKLSSAGRDKLEYNLFNDIRKEYRAMSKTDIIEELMEEELNAIEAMDDEELYNLCLDRGVKIPKSLSL